MSSIHQKQPGSRGAVFALGWALLAGGCSDPDGRLLSMHFSQHRKQEAKDHWNQVRGGVRLQLAEQHLKARRFDEAERALEEAMALCPGDASAFVLATKLRLEKGQIGDARNAIGVAAALRPADAEVRFLAGLISQRYGEGEEACGHFEAASTLAPNEVGYLVAHVESLVALDRPVEGLERLTARLADFDENVPLRLLAARITRILGLREPTVAHLREAMRMTGGAPVIAVDLAEALVWAERSGDAVQIILPMVEDLRRSADEGVWERREGERKRSAVELPESVLIHLLAQALIDSGKADDAIKHLRRLMQTRPADVTTWRLYARAALTAADLEGADEALHRLAELSEMSAETWLMAGYVALRRGRNTEAADAARRATAADPQLASGYFLLGEAAEISGDISEARRAYERVVELDPGLTVARHRLEMLRRAAQAGATDGADGCVLE